ncbi:MAG: HAD-IIIC family phosphatase [Sphingomicrobium sp.]
MSFDVLSMPWLPEAPVDFKQRCKSFDREDSDLGDRLRALASHRLTSSHAIIFQRTLGRLLTQGADLAPLSSFRLAILPSFTMDTIAGMIPAACARHGVAVDVAIAEFDQIVQTAFNPDAEVFRERPDGVLFLFDHRWIGLDRVAPSDDGSDRIDLAIDRLRTCVRRIREQFSAQCILSTIAAPPGTLFGSLERALPAAMRFNIDRFNQALVVLAAEERAILFDVAALAEQAGTARWFDPVAWYLYKIPFSADCSGLFADWLGRLLGAVRGKSRKCLVLDCDNTLWGGVIGDDGIENIVIGSGSGLGESFADVQQLALDLKARGILLAVCSKNNLENARLPFAEHPDMLIRESDIAVFQANWTDKPTNLEAIADALQIGLDSLVLLDDNPAERAQVRAALPMVAVPELPADPAYYAHYLSSAGYFEALTFSDEDRKRSDSYSANVERTELREQLRDLGDYLSALDMVLSTRPFDAVGRQRIAQLINKSNQFNVATRRYTEAEVERFERDPDIFTMQVRLRDKYSDYGMIGVCIATTSENDATAWDVDTWLMSCRVLGRKVEEAMLQTLVGAAREAGKMTIRARYLRTAKNNMVADLFDRLGFERIDETSDGDRTYCLDVEGVELEKLPHTRDDG